MDEQNQTTFDVVAEIKNAVLIIDHAAERGAFRGWEAINNVWSCRNRMLAFVQLMEQALAESQQETTTVEDQPATDSVVNENTEATQTIDDSSMTVDDSTSTIEEQEVNPSPDNTGLKAEYEEMIARLEKLRQSL